MHVGEDFQESSNVIKYVELSRIIIRLLDICSNKIFLLPYFLYIFDKGNFDCFKLDSLYYLWLSWIYLTELQCYTLFHFKVGWALLFQGKSKAIWKLGKDGENYPGENYSTEALNWLRMDSILMNILQKKWVQRNMCSDWIMTHGAFILFITYTVHVYTYIF